MRTTDEVRAFGLTKVMLGGERKSQMTERQGRRVSVFTDVGVRAAALQAMHGVSRRLLTYSLSLSLSLSLSPLLSHITS